MKKRHPFNSEHPFSASFAIVSRVAWEFHARGDEVDIDIFDQIGQNFWGEGTSAADFVRELRDHKNAARINLHINSPGGYVNEGLVMYNAILEHPSEVIAYIEGQAASAASFIAMAANKVVMRKTSSLFIHDAQGFAIGNAEDMRLLADILDEESDNIAGIYADKAGGTPESWREAMKANDGFGSTYRGQDAVDAGLADEVSSQSKKNVAGARGVGGIEPGRVAAMATAPDEDEEPDVEPELFKQVTARGYEPPMPTDISRLIERNLVGAKGGTANA